MIEFYREYPVKDIQMNSSTPHYWILYLYRGIEDYDIDYMKKVWRITEDSEDDGSNVILEEMQYDPSKRLWDQQIDKITELEDDLKLNDRDCFLFLISSSILDHNAYETESAYTLKCAPHYPDKDKRLIGEMYIDLT
jgi:hypothetical protein